MASTRLTCPSRIPCGVRHRRADHASPRLIVPSTGAKAPALEGPPCPEVPPKHGSTEASAPTLCGETLVIHWTASCLK